MTKEQFDRCIIAMESGQYKWGRDSLYNKKTDCYCPVGLCSLVLCGSWLYKYNPADPIALFTSIQTEDELIDYNDTIAKGWPDVIAYFNQHKQKIVD